MTRRRSQQERRRYNRWRRAARQRSDDPHALCRDLQKRPIRTEAIGELLAHARWRRIDWTSLGDGRYVSTVFLAIEHPIDMWFESALVISSAEKTRPISRASTLEQAKLMHQQVVAALREQTS